MFDKKYFKRNQKRLLWLLNTPIIKNWFRWVMRIDQKARIDRIDPNGFFWKIGTKRVGFDIRTHNKYSKRLYYGFYYVWMFFHFLDMNFINDFVPKWNLGFDSFGPIYPDSGSGVTACDGTVKRTGVTDFGFSTIRQGAGTHASATSTVLTVALSANNVTFFAGLERSIINFDTSAIDGDVDTATLSLYGYDKTQDMGTPNLDIVSANPASAGSLASTDYDYSDFGETVYDTISYSSFSTSSYNDYDLNSSGIANIDTEGVSSFGWRTSWDTTGVFGGTMGLRSILVYAKSSDWADDPKLSGTFTSAGGGGSALFFSNNF